MLIRRMSFVFALAGLLVLAATTAATAQDVVNTPLKEGKMYWVTRSDGSEIRGFITTLTATDVRVSGALGEVSVPTRDVLRISKVDGLWNGFAIGAGVGLAYGIPWTLSDEVPGSTGQKALFTLAVSSAYGGLGALLDKAIERRTTVYQRPGGATFALAPTASQKGLGVRGVVRW
jgi:hypothetical protein